MYGIIVIDHVKSMSESLIGEEQCGFMKGRGRVEQMFKLWSLVEKVSEKKIKSFME